MTLEERVEKLVTDLERDHTELPYWYRIRFLKEFQEVTEEVHQEAEAVRKEARREGREEVLDFIKSLVNGYLVGKVKREGH